MIPHKAPPVHRSWRVHAKRKPIAPGRVGWGVAGGGAGLSRSRRRLDGQVQGEDGALAGGAFQRQPPAQQARQLLGDGQAQARPGGLLGQRAVGLVELLEDALLVGLGDARPGVGDGDGDLLRAWAAPSAAVSTAAETITLPPAGVNLIALDSRL